MKSFSELKTLDGWYHFAQRMCSQVEFTGADDSIPALVNSIKTTLSISKLPFLELYYLMLGTDVLAKQHIFAADDEYQIMSWVGATKVVIQEELNRRVEEMSKDAINLDADFVEILTQEIHYQNELPKIETLSRYKTMFEQLDSFQDLLMDYEEYIQQTYTDFTKNQKLNIIHQLRSIIEDPISLPFEKIYQIDKMIQNKKNQAILSQSSWGEKIINFVKNKLSIFFINTSSTTEIYKSKISSLRQESLSSLKNADSSKEKESHTQPLSETLNSRGKTSP